MKFIQAGLAGAYVVEPEPLTDERGFFARVFCSDEFAAHGLARDFVQCNVSFNKKKGTLRGMHYQETPYAEAKLVRCSRGAIFDVIVDIRDESPTRGRWISVELSAENRKMIYVPAGFAHGFQALADDTEVFYHMSERYQPGAARGLRWNDPRLAIVWPLPGPLVSARDAGHPDFE